MPQRSRTEPSQLTILHLVQPVEGGVARVVTDLVKAQTEEGLHAIVACPTGGELGPRAAAVGAEVHRWHAVRAPGPRLALEVRTAARLIRRLNPDLVHAHSAKAGLVARLAVRGRIPTVFQPHAWSFDAVTGSSARLALAWERYGTRWSTRTLCVSETERRAGEAAGIAARWTVIRNGVDLDHFGSDAGWGGAHDADLDRRQARAEVAQLGQVPDDAPLVLCVGRLCRQKGQDILLTAWPRITAAVPDARLLLVGDGPDRESLVRSAPAKVTFVGAISDIRPWLRAADLLVLPSRWEGMALAPLEAMACGKPVVVSDVSGARESLPPGHEAHCLVPPDDPAALATAVTALLSDRRLRTALGDEARTHTRAACDIRTAAAAVSGLYQDLLSSPHPLTRKSATR
ncbi:glycosyltransferase [Streptomyces albipurpureus]|uniref:Glycosyltransferase n=1 Tax=Streptomyces albipurpureus TaxID=2897419 RepID=A0ABT0ULU5_9ACTN|nr:glycosyltransferase [Streptomyces sp. CWNU-1]MCM2389211.1 glycosyltransferase [Streptomyces sp. CWNU-1]